MGKVADLQALAAPFRDLERDPDVRAVPKAGPRMVTGFQPSALARRLKPSHRWQGAEQRWESLDSDHERLREAGYFASIYAAAAQAEAPEGPEPVGLSIARNCDRPPRHGLLGLGKAGRDNVSDSLALLEERRPLLSFWTVSLPGAALRAFAERDSWPVFVNRLLAKLRRALVRALGAALYVGVAELQPDRTRREGMPCPHLHIVFLGRKHRLGSWALSTNDLDEIIEESAREAGLIERVSFAEAGNVEQVKKSVRAYLSKYMTKGSSDVRRWIGTAWEALLPRQWWCWSDSCRALVRSCTVQLPAGFLAWAWRHRERLLSEKACYLQQCKVPSDAPATYRFCWGNVSRLAALIAEWQASVDDSLILARQEYGVWLSMGEVVYAKPLVFRT